MKIEVRILAPADELAIAYASPFRGKTVIAFMWNPVIIGYSSSLKKGHCDFAWYGHPFFAVLNPNLANLVLVFRHTGSKKPIFERSPNVQRHGHLGKLATQLSIRDFVTGKFGPPGNRNDAIFIAPCEPLVSDQQASSRPRSGPSRILIPMVRVDCAIGIMMANLSTNLAPSCRSIVQPVCSTSLRNALTHCTGETLTSKSVVAFRTMMLPSFDNAQTTEITN